MASLEFFLVGGYVNFILHVQSTLSLPSVNMDFVMELWLLRKELHVATRGAREDMIR